MMVTMSSVEDSVVVVVGGKQSRGVDCSIGSSQSRCHSVGSMLMSMLMLSSMRRMLKRLGMMRMGRGSLGLQLLDATDARERHTDPARDGISSLLVLSDE